jgi:hypothetical protein
VMWVARSCRTTQIFSVSRMLVELQNPFMYFILRAQSRELDLSGILHEIEKSLAQWPLEDVSRLTGLDVFGHIHLDLWSCETSTGGGGAAAAGGSSHAQRDENTFDVSREKTQQIRTWRQFLKPTSENGRLDRTVDGSFIEAVETALDVEELAGYAVALASLLRAKKYSGGAYMRLFWGLGFQSVMNLKPPKIEQTTTPALIDAFQSNIDWITKTIIRHGLADLYNFCDNYARNPEQWRSWNLDREAIESIPLEMRLPKAMDRVSSTKKNNVSKRLS